MSTYGWYINATSTWSSSTDFERQAKKVKSDIEKLQQNLEAQIQEQGKSVKFPPLDIKKEEEKPIFFDPEELDL